MALNAEVIKQNESLKELSDDQIKAIETLSVNDENEVIAKKTREIYDYLDNDVKETLGDDYKKPDTVKTYDHLKQNIFPLAKKATEYETKVNEYEQSIASLQEQLKGKSTDEALKQKLKDTETQLQEWQNKYNTDKQEWEKGLSEREKQAVQMQVTHELDKSLTGLKFKSEVPENVRESYINSVKNNLLTKYKPDFIDDGKSGKRLVFRNENGDILNNPENQLNPYTAKELLQKELKDIVDSGKQQPGAGTSGKNGNSDSVHLDLSGAKTQVEVNSKIKEYLLKSGMSPVSKEFSEKQIEMIKEVDNYKELPMN